MKKIDIEAILYMIILNLKEEKNKNYSPNFSNRHAVYLFANNEELKAYFQENGIDDINNQLLDLCIFRKTKLGTIISFKEICDHTITRYKQEKELTQSQVDRIHKKGKITPFEKVKEWESFDLCAPGDNIGSAADRCHSFSSCHNCLTDYAYKQKEYDKLELKEVLSTSLVKKI